VDHQADVDSYTHRSGRTGRAGRKGTSAIVVAPRELPGVRRVIGRASVRLRIEPLPDPEAIRRARDERRITSLTEGDGTEIDPRALALAAELVQRGDVEKVLARLLAQSADARAPEPRNVQAVEARPQRPGFDRPGFDRPGFERRPDMRGPPPERGYERRGQFEGRSDRPQARTFENRGFEGRPQARTFENRGFEGRGPDHRGPEGVRPEGARPERRDPSSFTLFHVTWGERQGADARRVLAMICRRGQVASHEVGAIRVGENASEVQIASEAAERFAEATRRRDPRDPSVQIRPDARAVQR